MILSNNVIKTFEVSTEQFSQLRYGVAKVSCTIFAQILRSFAVFLTFEHY
jgi:hypothetical protein